MLDNPRTHFGHRIAASDDFDLGVTNDGNRYVIKHLPSGETFEFGVDGANVNSIATPELSISDSGGNPTSPGEARQNNGDFKVYSGGGVRNLTNVGSSYTDEEAQDAVNTLLSAGSNVSLSYDDANNTLTITSTDSDTQLTTEEVQDIVGGFVTSSGATSVTYDDINNVLEISSTDTNTQLSDNDVRTAVEGNTDVADLAGGLGSSGQIPETDGTSVSWVTPTDTNTQAYSLAASGSTTLSSGVGTADTGIATDSGHYDVNINPGSADIAVSLDGSGTNYIIHMEENTTSVGNPTVGWQLMESNL